MLTTFVSVALLALAGQAAPPAGSEGGDAPVSTSPSAVRAQPAPPPVEPPAPPTGDYTYVAGCFGSLSGYLEAQDQALPEVERIERTWAGKIGTTTAEQALAEYAQITTEARVHSQILRRALAAAEGASPRAMILAGQTETASAKAKWSISDKAALAREWMSWTLPDRCLKEAAVLEERSALNTALLRSSSSSQAPAQPAATPQN